MSDSASSAPTKTSTDSSSNSNSSESPLVPDRWTNNISYQQLVVSSCVSVLQLWWHPYIHDLTRLLPFLFLYNVFSVIIGYPMFYLELAMGVVTRKDVIAMWDLAPVARGVGFAMLVTCAFTALAASAVGAWALAQLVHTAHAFPPWLHCAAAARPPCAARHRPLGRSETPAQSFFFNFVLGLKRDEASGLGSVVVELTVYFTIVWTLVYFVAIKRIYSYSKLVMFKDVLAYFVLVCCAAGVLGLHGAQKMFTHCDWRVLFEGTKMWREAIEYCLVEMAISQGTLIMLGSYCPKQQTKLSNTVLCSFIASKTCCMASALILGATHGALLTDYDTDKSNIRPGSAASMVLWADFVARVPGSQFWSALVFFTLFVLAVAFVALSVQTIMSVFSGRSVQGIAWAFLVLICCIFCIIGVMTLCTSSGLYALDFLMTWPITRPRTIIAAFASATVTYVYGQTTFCEDVYFAVGEYPCLFVRICWAVMPFILTGACNLGYWLVAMVIPIILSVLPCCVPMATLDATNYMYMMLTLTFISGATIEASLFAVLLAYALTFVPIVIVFVVYMVFKCRVRNIVRNEK